MITKSFSGATGTGVRHFVAAQTKQVATSDILIIAAHPELAAQWADILPGAQAITASKWQPTGQHKLIIADEMHDYMFSRLITPLQQIDAPVWLINRDIPVTPFIAAAPQQLGCEPF